MAFSSFLASAELFRGLTDSVMRDLETELLPVWLPGGENLMRQGEPGDCLYVLVSGRLRAYFEREDGTEVVVGEVGCGEVVGEMALLTDEARSVTVRAVRDSELLKFPKEVFERFIEKYPQAMMHIARASLIRYRRAIHYPHVTTAAATITLVPAGQGAPLSSIAARLSEALSRIGPTLHLNHERFRRELSNVRGALEQRDDSTLSSWLNEQEAKYRFIVYESELKPTPWTRRCLRQADHILAIGVAGSDPAPGEVETEILRLDNRRAAPRHDLVLLQPDNAERVSGTNAWLSVRRVDAHHHVRRHSEADLERLTRFVAGRAVGLVLGGGGALGISHIGALRAIREQGIPIDLIGGTSIGAIIGAGAAMGWDTQRLMERVKMEANGGSLRDFTLPFVSLISGRRISAILTSVFEDRRIEDLWVNYFCVSSNLTRAEVMVHKEGLLSKSIRASVSLPGILPPIPHNSDLLVDGGLMNNLPVDVMRRLCNGGRVLAVNVNRQVDLACKGHFGDWLSGWRVLWSRLNPLKSALQVPPMAGILLRATSLRSAQAEESLQSEADLCLKISGQCGILDFKSVDEIAEIGYQSALQQLQHWPPATVRERTLSALDVTRKVERCLDVGA